MLAAGSEIVIPFVPDVTVMPAAVVKVVLLSPVVLAFWLIGITTCCGGICSETAMFVTFIIWSVTADAVVVRPCVSKVTV